MTLRRTQINVQTILLFSLNHSLAVVELGDHCIMLGTGCGNNGRMPGNARGSVEFVKLEIKVSNVFLCPIRCGVLQKEFSTAEIMQKMCCFICFWFVAFSTPETQYFIVCVLSVYKVPSRPSSCASLAAAISMILCKCHLYVCPRVHLVLWLWFISL